MSLRERILSMVDDRPIYGVPPEGLAPIIDEQLRSLMRRSGTEFLPSRFYTLSNDAIALLKRLPKASILSAEIESGCNGKVYALMPDDMKLADYFVPHLKNTAGDDKLGTHIRLTFSYLYDLKRAQSQGLFFKVRTTQTPDTVNEICVDMVANLGATVKVISGSLYMNANILEPAK